MTISNETRRRAVLITMVAASVAVSGCALNRPRDVSSLLVRRGKPTLSFDDSGSRRPSTKGDTGEPLTGVDRSPRKVTSAGTTVETTDHGLRDALALAGAANTAQNRLRLAAEYRRLRILDEAYDQVTLALKLDPKCAAAFEQRAQIWREWGFANLGLSDAYRAVFAAPGSPSAQNTLGTLLQALGDTTAARRAYKRALDLDPTAAYAWSNLCYLSLVSGKQERAITECESAVKQDGGLKAARNNLAWSYAANDRLDAALETLAAGGDSADAEFNIGLLYLSLGRYSEAERSFRTASELRPDFVFAQTRRRQAARLAQIQEKVE